MAGFIGEPIQGVGGFITPPKEYFGIVAEIVRRYGGLIISDEVQTGWGRTGNKWFGIEQYGVTPDIITSAKGLANGSPIGLTVARPDVADSVKGLTISTFGGNPVTSTAAKAVIDFIEEHDLRTNTAETGAYLRGKLEELKEKHALIGDVPTLVGTDNKAKMSKSLGNAIMLSDDEATVRQKVMNMYTDPTRIRADIPGNPDGNPVFQYHGAFNPDKEEVEDLKSRYRAGQVGDVEVKKKLNIALQNFLTPIRERRAHYEARPQLIDEILEAGRAKVAPISEETVRLAREAMGLRRKA